eukprot:TRINITY_DN4859_c0_g1_i1.p1 TRINITY_DN4859_c0_g1~~TRINITY_DN4859_c0_g1_i1.p1  ORF type:complete len:384 (-),score=64.05 TRINITY_DN4859_c0_g1_i1:25-1176(-)
MTQIFDNFKSGCLYQSIVFKKAKFGWKKRYLALKPNFYLELYSKASETKPKRIFELYQENIDIEIIDYKSEKKVFIISIHDYDEDTYQQHYFRCEDESQTTTWKSLLRQFCDARTIDLLQACEEGNIHYVKALLNIMDADTEHQLTGRRPLHFAARNGQTDIITLLIKKGAGVDCEDKMGYTPLALCIRYNHFHTTKYLLTEGAKTESNGMFNNVIMIAIDLGNLDMIELLLDYNCNFNVTDATNSNPLHIAAENNDILLLQLLFNKTNLKSEIDSLNQNGETPLAVSLNQYILSNDKSRFIVIDFFLSQGAKRELLSTKLCNILTSLYESIEEEDLLTYESYLESNSDSESENSDSYENTKGFLKYIPKNVKCKNENNNNNN